MSFRHRSPIVDVEPPEAKRRLTMNDVPDFLADRGPSVTVATVAYIAGLSHSFILEDIRNGVLPATNVSRHVRPSYRIAFVDAKRYLTQLGALKR